MLPLYIFAKAHLRIIIAWSAVTTSTGMPTLADPNLEKKKRQKTTMFNIGFLSYSQYAFSFALRATWGWQEYNYHHIIQVFISRQKIAVNI